jgi:hypothetical protein
VEPGIVGVWRDAPLLLLTFTASLGKLDALEGPPSTRLDCPLGGSFVLTIGVTALKAPLSLGAAMVSRPLQTLSVSMVDAMMLFGAIFLQSDKRPR